MRTNRVSSMIREFANAFNSSNKGKPEYVPINADEQVAELYKAQDETDRLVIGFELQYLTVKEVLSVMYDYNVSSTYGVIPINRQSQIYRVHNNGVVYPGERNLLSINWEWTDCLLSGKRLPYHRNKHLQIRSLAYVCDMALVEVKIVEN